MKGHLQTQNWSFDALTAMALATSLRFEFTGPQSLLNKVLEGGCYYRYKSAAIALSGAPESFRLTLLPILQEQTDPLKQTWLGLLLMYMGFEQGTQAFLEALQHQNIAVRSLALQEVIALPTDLLERKGEANVKFCLRHAFLECQPLWAPLRCHPDHHVAGLVIGAYAERGCDEGTLAIMAEHLLEPSAGQQDLKNYVVCGLLLSLS